MENKKKLISKFHFHILNIFLALFSVILSTLLVDIDFISAIFLTTSSTKDGSFLKPLKGDK